MAGLSIEGIAAELAKLPNGRTPTATDWREISVAMRGMLDQRIATIERIRDRLDGCIGCGCLSLDKCALYNPDDKVAARGTGPMLVLPEES